MVDQALPITIEPSPAKLERVFVARLEVITPSQESNLIALLQSPLEDEAVAREKLKALHLGRFSHGALAIALRKFNETITNRFQELIARD